MHIKFGNVLGIYVYGIRMYVCVYGFWNKRNRNSLKSSGRDKKHIHY